MKQKTCKNKDCKKKFNPERQMQGVCSYECSIAYAKQLKEKRELQKKKDNRKRLREFNNNHKPTLLQKAQQEVNKYVRLRDIHLPCISCGHDFSKGRQAHAGHFIPVSKSSLLRFDLFNIHKQCNICNDHLSGNLIPYKDNLIKKIGIDKVEWLESNQRALKSWSNEELKEIIKEFKIKNKQILNKN